MITNDNQNQLIKTARTAGFWYLLMAIAGILGFMVFHSQVFVAGDPGKTLDNLIHLESTARIRLLFEFIIVISQALTAVWFYRLFKNTHEWAAWTLGIGGIINSVVLLFSAISMASAIGIAGSATLGMEEKTLLIQLLQSLIANSWGVGGLFFGLWLFPMAFLVIQSKRMPVWLGRIILLGGIGYLISTIINYMGIEFSYNIILILPATVGEFWMIGYLLIFGIRPLNK
ncbi:MAG: DUF4386 domain-containing protein [Cyclobacteriaceae bacterium]|nr:DUF4386 domain-containing protein [Cyclobacteriaceae bacterium]